MSHDANNPSHLPDDAAEYLQTFLDETEEQLDDLVETMLELEQDTSDREDLNEAFRLIHSIKGSAGIMGLENITVLTHHLETRFESFRSGREQLDERTMNLVLRCIDFLRDCTRRLRATEELGSPRELLDELKRLEAQAHETADNKTGTMPDEATTTVSDKLVPPPTGSPTPELEEELDECLRLVVRFREGLQLIDLKARLIVSRLSALGTVRQTRPDLAQSAEFDNLESFEVLLETDADSDHLRSAVDVDGVEAVDFRGSSAQANGKTESVVEPDQAVAMDSALEPDRDIHIEADAEPQTAGVEADQDHELATAELAEEPAPAITATHLDPPAVTADKPPADKAAAKVAETMRVDIDRLDNLMNLTGELVVNRARFEQISRQLDPAWNKANLLNNVRELGENLRRTISELENGNLDEQHLTQEIGRLRQGLEFVDQQSRLWENGRQCFAQIGEAIDQLSRVSGGMQRGVLDARMVPVSPLFNRFKRVVRDLSLERGKQVQLVIQGEKTELDKRMIDELGDPLVHLVRNAVDHGLEPTSTRIERGKPETGTITLRASHRGNSVHIEIEDDGGGIDIENIKARLVDRGILESAAELSASEALEYIWHPGFSTAREVTDVSGRGVGMDVVRTRINQLSGTIDVQSNPGQGTRFTIRLPLTLAIINCLLVRLNDVVFSIPIDDIREIVSVPAQEIVNVMGKRTFSVRGEYLPLFSVNDLLHWNHGVETNGESQSGAGSRKKLDVVILQSAGKTIGLAVDEFLGSQDIVIKSLSENFRPVRGLAGASILGDGDVALMLDVGGFVAMANRNPANHPGETAH